MMLIGILPAFTLIISGIIYFGVKVLERLLNKSIMGYVILLLIIAFIGIYGLLYFSEDDGCGGGVIFLATFAIDFFIITFFIIEKLYKKFRARLR
ncbi:hypothetical protein [Clostridium beijerinckii]|uniref:Uncharacterized protein n=1 Tax=Clostridium beijerinckii TaxID=1520 RepID=A0A1S8SAZ4_CLOBE|nr:hypothetical protein [Clostridium beijerinckii]NRY59617.1 hypothetical protein [Clostridium beijerinckii]OOM62740.1 hypothetical protein CLBCK_15090 [Clostridium beijerinckii]